MIIFILILAISVSASSGPHSRRLPGSRYTLEELAKHQLSLTNDIRLYGRYADPPLDSNVSITISPSTPLLTDIVNVTLTFTVSDGSQNGTTDWIGQVCVGYPLETYLEWAKIRDCPTWLTGTCSMTFTVFRARCDYVFQYFRGKQPIWPTGVVLAISNPITWAVDSQAPFHTHTAFGGDDTQHSMYVSCSTNTSATIIVQVGLESGVYSLPNATDVESTTYGPGDLCNSPANTSAPFYWSYPGYFHHVLVHNLLPGTRYYVRAVADDIHIGEEVSFVTALPLGPEVSFSFVAFGDMSVTQQDYQEDGGNTTIGYGAVGTSQRVSELIQRGGFDAPLFITHFGDLGYAKGYVMLWDAWMSMMKQMKVPYMVSVGNHEYDYRYPSFNDPSGVSGGVHNDMPKWFDGDVDSLGECGVGTVQRFRAPQSPGSNGIFWYNIQSGSVFIITLSSEHDTSPNSPQRQFLERSLASVDRSVTPWLIVTQHRHIYHFSGSEQQVQDGYLANMEALFMQYKVDLVLMGHTHNYLRTVPIYNYTHTPDAPVYITTGSAGALLESYGIIPGRENLVAAYDSEHTGFSHISAMNSTHLRIRWITNVDGNVFDESYIVH